MSMFDDALGITILDEIDSAPFDAMAEEGTVVWASDWPEIKCATVEAAFEVSDWVEAVEQGVITAADFIEVYGVHPDADWQIVVEVPA